MKIPLRIVLYPKDVEHITGRSDRTARNILQKIRKALGKSKDQFVTVREFCAFYGLEEEYVKEFLRF
jgi:transcriptional antiterminator